MSRRSSNRAPASRRPSPTPPTRKSARESSRRTSCTARPTSSARCASRPPRKSSGSAKARRWSRCSSRSSTRRSCRRSPDAASPPSRWTSSRASRALSRWTRSRRRARSRATRRAILAAEHLGKFFPMLTTAAGTIPPAKVLVLGAGVAGLQAIATARRLGAVVSAFDVRPVVKEQVESLGASFLELDVEGAEGRRWLRRRARRGPARARAGAHRPPRRRVGRGHHDGADPRPPGARADHRGGRARHARRLGDRRPRRRGGRQLRRRRSRARRS